MQLAVHCLNTLCHALIVTVAKDMARVEVASAISRMGCVSVPPPQPLLSLATACMRAAGHIRSVPCLWNALIMPRCTSYMVLALVLGCC